jgi:hypothetical protein
MFNCSVADVIKFNLATIARKTSGQLVLMGTSQACHVTPAQARLQQLRSERKLRQSSALD